MKINPGIAAAMVGAVLILVFIAANAYFMPSAHIVLAANPPAKVTCEIYQGEVIIQPLDKDDRSTRAGGSAIVDVSMVDTLSYEGVSTVPLIRSAVKMDDFQVYYINHRGYDSNIYAVRTGVHLPKDQNLYLTRVTYYPIGERYSLENSTLSRGDDPI